MTHQLIISNHQEKVKKNSIGFSIVFYNTSYNVLIFLISTLAHHRRVLGEIGWFGGH